MVITFSEKKSVNKAKMQIELSDKAILASSGAMKTFLDAYSDLCSEIAHSDIATDTLGARLFSNDLLEVKIKP